MTKKQLKARIVAAMRELGEYRGDADWGADYDRLTARQLADLLRKKQARLEQQARTAEACRARHEEETVPPVSPSVLPAAPGTGGGRRIIRDSRSL